MVDPEDRVGAGCPDDGTDTGRCSAAPGARPQVTRREVLVGAGAMAGAHFSGLAHAQGLTRWQLSIDPDPDWAGRRIVEVVARNGTHACSRRFREIAFGERARAQIERLAPPAESEHLDWRLIVRGLRLAGADAGGFDLLFDFRQQTALREAQFDLRARGWVFGDREVVLCAGNIEVWSAAAWRLQRPDLGDSFLKAIFGAHLQLPDKPARLTTELLPGTCGVAPSEHLRWRFSVGEPIGKRAPFLAILAHPQGEALRQPGRVEATRLAAASSVTVWREAAPRTSAQAPRAAAALPRTLAELGAAVPSAGTTGTRTTLAEHRLRSGHRSTIEFHRRTANRETYRETVRLTRVDGNGSGRGRITVDCVFEGDLALRVVTEPVRKRKMTEGPFRCRTARITLTGEPDARTLDLRSVFELSAQHVDVRTAFGVLELSAPEDKRERAGADSGPHPARLRATNWQLEQFEVAARVHSAGVALQDAADTRLSHRHVRGAERLAPHGYGAQLVFPGGTELLFRLHAHTDRAGTRPGIGRVSLGWAAEVREPDGLFGPPFALPLDNAVLRILRWRDLAALTYRFSGLDLAMRAGGLALVPRGLARAHDRAPDARSGNVPRAMTAPAADPRPLMVVELPPQHVAEEAFFERRTPRVSLPAVPMRELPPEAQTVLRTHFAELRRLYGTAAPPEAAKRRIAARKAIQKILEDARPQQPPLAQFVAFMTAFKEERTRPANRERSPPRLPAEQWIYVGPEFLDPAARLVAEYVEHHRISRSLPAAVLFDDAPDDPLNEEDLERLQTAKADPAEAARLRQRRSPFYVKFKEHYDGRIGSRRDLAGLLTVSKELGTFAGRAALRDAVEKLRTSTAGATRDLQESLRALGAFVTETARSAEAALGLTGVETPAPISRARLSGPSRLAFRLNTDDSDETEARSGGAIPLSVDELTNWSRHELVVVRRAQKVFRTYGDGSARPGWDRQEETDLARMLTHQGFSRGGDAGPGIERLWPNAAVTVEQRLAEVVQSATAPPDGFETAIELPFRLFLSPSQDGRFRTRRRLPEWLVEITADETAKLVVEPLWVAELQPGAALRAVWSPDFRPEAFLPPTEPGADGARSPTPARTNRAPLRGPYAPWAVGRDVFDAGGFGASNPAPVFRTSLDAFDRHELVALSSLHGLPVAARQDSQGQRLGTDQREPPPGFDVATAGWSPQKRPEAGDLYLPRPLDPDGLELGLSSLGGFLRVNASFEPPAAIMDGRGPLFDALTIERWRHRIALGRDISAEIVYKGYLFPLGVRCTLIKITERRFQAVAGREGPVAVLRQRMFLRVGKPEIAFPAFQQADKGRRLPCQRVRLVTTVTPDIVDPYDASGQADSGTRIRASGWIALEGARGAAFWPRTARRPGAEVRFDLMLDETVPIRMPLVFVDNAAANDPKTVKKLCEHYNALGAGDVGSPGLALVEVEAHGAKLTYAPSKEAGDTQFETLSFRLGAEGRRPSDSPTPVRPADYRPLSANSDHSLDALMRGADQPPFYPAMRQARIKIAQTERLTAQPAEPVIVAFDPTYALYGFDPGTNAKEVFLGLAGSAPLAFGQAGDRGGAVGRPELSIRALSRTMGPVGHQDGPTGSGRDASSAAGSTENPDPVPDIASKVHQALDATTFFNDKARLLGLVTLRDVIEAAGFEPPKLRELTEFAGGQAEARVRENVLQPLADVLTALDARLAEIQIDDARGNKALALAYPDVDRARVELGLALKAALAAPPASDELSASLAVYTRVYTSARALINALDRALNDPVTPLKEAGTRLAEDLRAKLLGSFTSEVLPRLQALGRALDPRAARDWARDILRDEIMKPLASLIFAWPLGAPVMAGVDAAMLTAALTRAVHAALDAEGTWPKTGSLFDREAFWGTVVAGLRSARPGQQLQRQLAAEADRLQRLSADERRSLMGPLWPQVEAIRDAVDAVIAAVDEAGLDTLTTLWAALEKAGAALAQVHDRLRPLQQIGMDFQSRVQERCQAMVSALDAFVRMILPVDAAARVLECPPFASTACLEWQASYETQPFALAVAVVRFRSFAARELDDATSSLERVASQVSSSAAVDRTDAQRIARDIRTIRDAVTKFEKGLKAADDLGPLVTRLRDGIRTYQSLMQGAGSQCTDLSQVSDAVARAARQLTQLDADRLALTKYIVQLSAALDGALRTGEAGPLFTAGLPADIGAVRQPLQPRPFGNPSNWSWVEGDHTPGSIAAAAQIFDTVRKDIFGLLVPMLRASVAMLAQLSSAKPGPARGDFVRKARAVTAGLTHEARTFVDSAVGRLEDSAGPIATLAERFGNALEATELPKVLADTLQDPRADFGQVARHVDSIVTVASAVNLQALGTTISSDLIGQQLDLATLTQDPAKKLAGLERRLVAVLTMAALRANQAYDRVLQRALEATSPGAVTIVGGLADAFDAALRKRNMAHASVGDALKGLPPVLATSFASRLEQALIASNPGTSSGIDNDALVHQGGKLRKILNQLDPSEDPSVRRAALIEILEFVRSWTGTADPPYDRELVHGPNAALRIVANTIAVLDDLIRQVLRGNFVAVIDFNAIQREVERRIRGLIPARVTLAYDFDTPLSDFPSGDAIFKPDAGTRLQLNARTTIDLLRPEPPKLASSGTLGPFKIRLIGETYDIVTLSFDGARFGRDNGGTLRTNIVDVKLGQMVAFLEAVGSFFSFGSNGFFLRARFGPPAIEAGYQMPPAGFALGAMAITNLSLNASCLLPFNDAPAALRVGLSSPEDPFLISYSGYSGGGHLSLYASPTGIIGFEASFVFGALAAFEIGPLNGKGRVDSGIFLRSFRDGVNTVSTVEGVATAAGAAQITMFRFGAMLQVRVGQQATGRLVGTAMFVYSFSMGLRDIEFRIVLRREFPKGFGTAQGSASDHAGLSEAAGDAEPIRMAQPDAVGATRSATQRARAAQRPLTIASTAASQTADYAGYRNAFSDVRPWQPDVWSRAGQAPAPAGHRP